jgi:hypothetical protein
MKVKRKVPPYFIVQPTVGVRKFYIMDINDSRCSPLFGKQTYSAIRYLGASDFKKAADLLITCANDGGEEMKQVLDIIKKFKKKYVYHELVDTPQKRGRKPKEKET